MVVITRSRAKRKSFLERNKAKSPNKSPTKDSPPPPSLKRSSGVVNEAPRNVARKTARVSAAYRTSMERQDFRQWLERVGAAADNLSKTGWVKNQMVSNEEAEDYESLSEESKGDPATSSGDLQLEGDHDREVDGGSSGDEFLTDFSEESEDDNDDVDVDNELNMRQFSSAKSAESAKRRKHTKAGSERRARGINDEDRRLIRKMINENKDPAVIVNAAYFRPHQRRTRIVWTATEVMHLRLGVERFGFAWSTILHCSDYKFHPHRTQVDLKDKWRNITNYRPYGSHVIREFIMVNENHQPLIRSDTGKPYHFKNRWPRDAALKAASRDEFYPDDSNITTLFVREIGDRDPTVPPIVHIYEGTRAREAAPPHLSQLEIRSVWHSEVRKIREERYISQDDLRRIERETHFRG